MLPSLTNGRVVCVLGWFIDLSEGSVIVFKHRELEKIKRVVRVDKKGLEVHGDNSAFSTDSRDYGLIQRDQVLGKLIWPRI